MLRADFYYPAVVECIGVDEHGLRTLLGQHLFQVGELQRLVERVLYTGILEKLGIRFGNSDDVNFRTVPPLVEKSVDVAVTRPTMPTLSGECVGAWLNDRLLMQASIAITVTLLNMVSPASAT